MLLRKLILPRWGALGREARDTAQLSASEKRRAHRVAASMPVLVYGHSAHAPFAEPATTMNVSRTGGLVPLSSQVIRFQKLIVTNLQTDEDAICRVARYIRNDDGHNSSRRRAGRCAFRKARSVIPTFGLRGRALILCED